MIKGQGSLASHSNKSGRCKLFLRLAHTQDFFIDWKTGALRSSELPRATGSQKFEGKKLKWNLPVIRATLPLSLVAIACDMLRTTGTKSWDRLETSSRLKQQTKTDKRNNEAYELGVRDNESLLWRHFGLGIRILGKKIVKFGCKLGPVLQSART